MLVFKKDFEMEIDYPKLVEIENTKKLIKVLENIGIFCLDFTDDLSYSIYSILAVVIIGHYLKRTKVVELIEVLVPHIQNNHSLEAQKTLDWIVSAYEFISGDSREQVLKTLKIDENILKISLDA